MLKNNVTNYINCWDDIPIKLMNNYTPLPNDRRIILERIAEKLKK